MLALALAAGAGMHSPRGRSVLGPNHIKHVSRETLNKPTKRTAPWRHVERSDRHKRVMRRRKRRGW